MLKIPLENILPLSEARSKFSTLVDQAIEDKSFLVTKGGKPVVVITGIEEMAKKFGHHGAISVEMTKAKNTTQKTENFDPGKEPNKASENENEPILIPKID